MVIVSGAGSGLGRFLHESLGGAAITRETPGREFERIRRAGADTVIHCAFNAARDVTTASLSGYVNDNILLTERLLSIPHRKFVFISSVDVYPKDRKAHSEDEWIAVRLSLGLYGLTKLISESLVAARSPGSLILRAGALLGKHSRRNSLIRILREEDCTLTLSEDSIINYVLHSDMLAFIEFALRKGLAGIYNAVSTGNLTLLEAASMAGNIVRFGSYRYDAGEVSNRKIAAVFPAFRKSSRDVVREFIKEMSDEKEGDCLR